jgi:hypothetical protein
VIGYDEVMGLLVDSCSSFNESPQAAMVDHQDGAYLHMAHLMTHLILLLAAGQTETFPAVFGTVELVLANGDSASRRLINVGLITDLTNDNFYQTVDVEPADFLRWYGPLAQRHREVQALRRR